MNRKIVYLQWAVIAVLVIGGAVGGYIMVHKLSDLQDDNNTIASERNDLRTQLQQVQAAETTASPAATPSPSPSASPSPTAAATKTPAPTHTPTPTPVRRR